ncbi:hypothetical protein LTR62_001067 [Meristemomyces frigidus]|uniref:Uncharacterized protein n=1 Tax=Meristemomyces frigidus TaxID=1508187 RepID=A0AAN7TJY9_9PEZI|nr:hypothetical protein LTR62_001067 [Meristemomyces frigidus]
MTLKDFFHLSEADFTLRLSQMTDTELLKDDIHNVRTTHSGSLGAVLGAVQAPVTAGVSLVGSAIGLRRRNVARRRLEMIHAELERRGLPLHQQTKRDFFIPLAIAGVTMGIGGTAVEAALGAMPVQSVVDAGIDAGTTAASMVVGEAAGKVVVETGGEHVLDWSLPGKGRRKVWREKMLTSRSSSRLNEMDRLKVQGEAELPLSAPASPGVRLGEPPAVPPRPVVGS